MEVREKQRGDRVIGQARAHYEYCHDGMQYDCEVDTGNNTIEENAKFIAYRVFQSLSTKPPFVSCKKIIISRHGETCSNLKYASLHQIANMFPEERFKAGMTTH